MRDQFRDRRTLFMVAVLPVLMYPLLGSTGFQLLQFMQQSVGRVAVYGVEELEAVEGLPELIEGERFAEDLFYNKAERERLIVELRDSNDSRVEAAVQALADDEIDVAICFPRGFGERLAAAREDGATTGALPPVPLRYDASRDASQVAGPKVGALLRQWSDAVVDRNLRDRNVPVAATRPLMVDQLDVAPKATRDAQVWAKLLPFVVLLWALTGAFYPAIDLCAGEKERGTLETLLASPARRSEIVGGKLLTVMSFSIFTALLNLASLAVTGRILAGQLAGVMGGKLSIGLPHWSVFAWIVVAVIPVAALFSALSLACAAYARSTKEGQYYFMPLFLGATPLMLVPLSPGVDLNLGNSLVPVMGLVLLLQAMIEGQTTAVLQYAAPVILSTAVCCWLAMRWAVSQFNQESVLFRESERFDLKSAAKAMFRNRGATPSAGAAIACVAGIFLMQNVVRSLMPAPVAGESGLGYFAGSVLSGQLLTILLPAVVVVWLLTRDWRATLLLKHAPRATDVALAGGLALCLHPLGQRLGVWIRQLYPLSDQVTTQLTGFLGLLGESTPIWLILLLMAALPAVCEEIAFRGVILSGLRKSLGDAGGVLMTAVFFGATHGILQQSLAAAPVGALIGVIALRTGSLVPCVVFHAAYNALQLLSALQAESIRSVAADWGLADAVFTEIGGGELGYATPIAILGGIAAAGLMRALGRSDRGEPQIAAQLGAAS